MENIKITVVGNGGCLNDGLPYNSVLFGEQFLIETPPDIMGSIKKLRLDFTKIDKIFISHFHGDHTFGMPFVIINRWVESIDNDSFSGLSIYGPENLKNYFLKLTELSFSTKHPCYKWAKSEVEFIEINKDLMFSYDNLSVSFFELEHIQNTYGFKISSNGKNLVSYIIDTKWCEKVEEILEECPKAVIIDVNGDPMKIHISLDDVIKKGIDITKDKTIYYGTHLSGLFESDNKYIKCAKQGDVINITT